MSKYYYRKILKLTILLLMLEVCTGCNSLRKEYDPTKSTALSSVILASTIIFASDIISSDPSPSPPPYSGRNFPTNFPSYSNLPTNFPSYSKPTNFPSYSNFPTNFPSYSNFPTNSLPYSNFPTNSPSSCSGRNFPITSPPCSGQGSQHNNMQDSLRASSAESRQQESVINSTENENSRECPICLEETAFMEYGKYICNECRQSICNQCYSKILGEQELTDECPLCRNPYN